MSQYRSEGKSAEQRLKEKILKEGIFFGVRKDGHSIRWMIDLKHVLLDPETLLLARDLLGKKIGGGTIASATFGSRILACALIANQRDPQNSLLVREKRKKDGMMGRIEGRFEKGRSVVLVQDVLDGFGSAREAVRALEEEGMLVEKTVSVVNFRREDDFLLRRQGCDVESLYTLEDFGLESRFAPQNPLLYSLLWKQPLPNNNGYTAPKASPVADEQRVYAGSDEGKMVAFNLDGNLAWEFSTLGKSPIYGTPLLTRDNIIFSDHHGILYCLASISGEEVWRKKISLFNGSSPIGDPGGDAFYIGLECEAGKGGVAAVRRESGEILWVSILPSYAACRPALSNGVLACGANDGCLYGLDACDGRILWNVQTRGAIKGRIASDDDSFYFGSFDGSLYRVGSDGLVKWKRKLGAKLYTGPLLHGGNVIAGSSSHQVSALEKESGEVRWHFLTCGEVVSYPSTDGELIYFGSSDGSVYAVDGISGKLKWMHMSAGGISSSPFFFNDLLMVSSTDGNLYCFKKNRF